ncbi:MAG: hypothetical protein ACI4PY_03710 [Akkermansia muciniphila]|nr:hypothetical protein [Akkermansia muciniphila]MCI7005363.1 hypothetical protein [Akkermansia muciniphila]
MKVLTFILASASALAFSSCCCQSQPMPKLPKMPKCDEPVTPPTSTPDQPVKVFSDKNKGK